jgi:hypothetical protein
LRTRFLWPGPASTKIPLRSICAGAILILILSLLTLTLRAQDKPRSLYDGAAIRFDTALLLKPVENTGSGLAAQLAALFVQETLGSNNPAGPNRVFYSTGTAQLNGQPHAQMTYWWQFRRSAAPSSTSLGETAAAARKAAAPITRGLRITLSTQGTPAIYEILEEGDHLAMVFVAQSLETAARHEFGPPLPGRHFSVEPGLTEAPRSVVPRILDEPPVVMGPILYLNAGTGSVATLICRCMDAQARQVTGTENYTLIPSNAPPPLASAPLALEKALRLPKSWTSGAQPPR